MFKNSSRTGFVARRSNSCRHEVQVGMRNFRHNLETESWIMGRKGRIVRRCIKGIIKILAENSSNNNNNNRDDDYQVMSLAAMSAQEETVDYTSLSLSRWRSVRKCDILLKTMHNQKGQRICCPALGIWQEVGCHTYTHISLETDY